ncbi:MAG: MaoC family dehydratase [Chloroflexi bacterium]|nr:MaoC family dehydratase [Chloroflexota bacterium]
MNEQDNSAISAEGWTGRCFEDFRVGDIYRHRLGRTVTNADNVWFTLLTMNQNPLHIDQHYSSQTEFGRPLVNSCFTLALITGMSVADVSQNAVANLGWEEVALPHPVFEGDTLYAESEVLSARPSASRPHAGIVQVATRGYNQDGTRVIEFKRSIMIYRRGHVPEPPGRPPGRARRS